MDYQIITSPDVFTVGYYENGQWVPLEDFTDYADAVLYRIELRAN